MCYGKAEHFTPKLHIQSRCYLFDTNSDLWRILVLLLDCRLFSSWIWHQSSWQHANYLTTVAHTHFTTSNGCGKEWHTSISPYACSSTVTPQYTRWSLRLRRRASSMVYSHPNNTSCSSMYGHALFVVIDALHFVLPCNRRACWRIEVVPCRWCIITRPGCNLFFELLA